MSSELVMPRLSPKYLAGVTPMASFGLRKLYQVTKIAIAYRWKSRLLLYALVLRVNRRTAILMVRFTLST